MHTMSTNGFSAGAVDPTPVVVQTAHGPVEYAEFGQGPAVVCLAGAMGGYDQSLLLARVVGTAGYRYLGVSRPGYLGTPLTSGHSAAAQADLLAALLDALGITDAVVMAVSGGGPCALTFVLRHPARCRGLVLVSTCGGVMEQRIPFAFHLMKFMARIPALAEGMRQKALAHPEESAARNILDPAVLARTLADPEAGPLLHALTASTMSRMSARLAGTENDIRITRTTSYPLEEIRVPTLVVHGTGDRVVPYEPHALSLSKRILGAELLSIPGGEHVAIFTHRAEVRARVAAFLAAHAAR
jgi:pimeloyl-ACP methyl ester carboxylesterase